MTRYAIHRKVTNDIMDSSIHVHYCSEHMDFLSHFAHVLANTLSYKIQEIIIGNPTRTYIQKLEKTTARYPTNAESLLIDPWTRLLTSRRTTQLLASKTKEKTENQPTYRKSSSKANPSQTNQFGLQPTPTSQDFTTTDQRQQCLNSKTQTPTAKTAPSATNPGTCWYDARSIRKHQFQHHQHQQHRHQIQTTPPPTLQQQHHPSNQAPGTSSAPAPAGNASAAASSTATWPRAGRGIGMGVCGRISMLGLVPRFRGG